MQPSLLVPKDTARVFNRLQSLGKAESRTQGDRIRTFKENDLKLTNMLNTPVQGTGADILKLALVTLNQRITNEVKILAVVHDEIILEVPEEKATHWAKVLSEAMIFAPGAFPQKCSDSCIRNYWGQLGSYVKVLDLNWR